ncbi:GATA-type zinc finger protein 1 isoform X1 [Oryzias melastigma]|nr:GATA-type zinc finger protein 1 isoform X1 [Oryzias melastigma]XP_024145999.1 GATA-type zinc finger protein 1 isoform X1 [Oryzias melastigma]XP_024146000.1 GATA-type zinc finger protein 1 isoform X1 [Oryzias melastigma]XP_024146001.1 GATA-type zinc finger protein 1 isoform X1 [Oryzias melastigma]
MSSRPQAEAVCIQESKSKVEHNDSPSALFYLFQEVSKLHAHSTLLDSNPPPERLKETSKKNPVFIKKTEDGRSIQVSVSSCQLSMSDVTPYHNLKNMREESPRSDLEETRRGCSSPLKALSLINLHCERLLQGGVEVSVSGSASCSNSAASLAAGQCQYAPSPVLSEKQERAVSAHPEQDRSDVQLQKAEKADAAGVKLKEDDSVIYFQPRCREEVKFSVNGELERSHGSSVGVRRILDLQHPGNADTTNRSLDDQLIFNPGEKAITLDQNANIRLSSVITHLPPPNPILPSSQLSVSFDSPSKQDHTVSAHESDSNTGETHRSAHFKSLSCDASPPTSEVFKGQREEIGLPSNPWRTKTRRKQLHPSRSADLQDPNFQGVMFRMDTELDDTREQCRLLITSKYSKELRRSVKKPKPRSRMSQKSLKTSSSDEENDLTADISKGKVCASCCTRKTPMWRDAEDGTPLCNACGIRYKKYRVRCLNCWHIPRKEGNSNSRCLKCGNFVRLTKAQRKHTI